VFKLQRVISGFKALRGTSSIAAAVKGVHIEDIICTADWNPPSEDFTIALCKKNGNQTLLQLSADPS